MSPNRFDRDSPARFVVVFLALFAIFYYFNIFFFGVTSPGNHYFPFLDENLNYIRLLRRTLLQSSAIVINWFGFSAIANDYELLVAGKGVIKLVYSCLGLGVMSFFSAFIIAYPTTIKSKLISLILGNLCIQLLNVVRFVLLAIFWDKKSGMIFDHHTLFNISIYLIIAICLYFWVRNGEKRSPENAQN
jgi:exosortase/archaeosortase family protein